MTEVTRISCIIQFDSQNFIVPTIYSIVRERVQKLIHPLYDEFDGLYNFFAGEKRGASLA